jgi:hypothetical protein
MASKPEKLRGFEPQQSVTTYQPSSTFPSEKKGVYSSYTQFSIKAPLVSPAAPSMSAKEETKI